MQDGRGLPQIESNATHCAVAMIKRRINRIVSSPCGNEHGSASVLAALLLYSYIGGMLVAYRRGRPLNASAAFDPAHFFRFWKFGWQSR